MTDTPASVVNEGERFFRELADCAPVMIWRAGTDSFAIGSTSRGSILWAGR